MKSGLLAFLVAGLLAACQSPRARAETESASLDRFLASWTDAMIEGDVDAAMAHYDASGVVVQIHSTGDVRQGLEAIRADYVQAFDSVRFHEVDFEVENQRWLDDSAWLTGRLWIGVPSGCFCGPVRQPRSPGRASRGS